MKTNPHETNRKFWLSAAIGLALLLVAATPRTARGQWASSGNNINNTNTGNVGIGTASPGAKVVVSTNPATLPPPPTNTMVQVGSADGLATRFTVDGFASPAQLIFRRADTTAASPSAIQSGDLIGRFGAWGYGSTGYSTFTTANIDFLADQTWTDSAQGSRITFSTSVNGSAAFPVERMRIDNAGNVGIGTTAPPTKLSIQPTTYNSAVDGIEFISSDNTTHSIIQPIKIAAGAMNLYLGSNSYIDTAGNFSRFNASAANASINVRSSDGTIRFNTNTSGGIVSERMQIDSAGNVGIGTMTPLARLDVRTGTVALPPGGGLDPNTYHTWFPFSDGKNYIRGTTIIADQGGSVGIGTAPNYKLDVAGDIRSTTGFRFQDNSFQTTAATMTGVTAGDGLTGGGTSGTVTLTNTDKGSTQKVFKNIATDITQFSADSNTETLRFAGSGGTTVTLDGPTKKITIDATGSTGSAANIAAGTFGQNTGNGNYTFPGNVTVNGNIAAKYQDMAEWVSSSEKIPTGTVVVLDSTRSNQVIASTQAYDTRVAGVISEQPGIALGESGAGKVLVATTGRVLVQVDASKSPIHIGDLLVTSDVRGVARKSEPVNLGGIQLHRPGTLIGKALEPLEKGSGKILVLLSLQ